MQCIHIENYIYILIQQKYDNFIVIKRKSSSDFFMNYPQPPSHRTFTFGNIIIDSNFDSGNCSNAQKVSNTNYNIWIGTDHPKNNYRTWFYFSVEGFSKGATVTFKIKNMQNQSRLLNQGLNPVFREENSNEWRRITERVNTSNIEYYDGWIQWPFKHTWNSDGKAYFAFFYPWSNNDNSTFLEGLQQKTLDDPDIYFHRTTIINSLQGRPIEFIVISSNKGKLKNKQELINDENLFKKGKKPCLFDGSKKGIVIGARVHPGQVPGSHVMTGILQELTQKSNKMNILRDNFIFYIFPIFNPDGVARGHYRVDTNGINLNRCYINPTVKSQPSIYAVKKIIMHLHNQGKFFAFLDLHAHAARKGTFIYGNYTNQLMKQIDTCLFPKILSMNSIDFEYEGSNFTQKNMNCKDRGDHMSKQGSGRVAIFKATKNAYCWTLQCNYNISKVNNILDPRKEESETVTKPDQNQLDQKLIIDYRYPSQKEAKQFFTIETYRKLGKQICQSFLDLIQKNPESRIDNPKNHFKSVQNLKMNLAVALLRMQPTRFETNFRKIYNGINNKDNKQIFQRSLKALYLLVVQNAKIQNINGFLKDGDTSGINYPSPKKPKSLPSNNKSAKFSSLLDKNSIRIRKKQSLPRNCLASSDVTSDDLESPGIKFFSSSLENNFDENVEKMPSTEMVEDLLLQKLRIYEKQKSCHKVSLKFEEFKLVNISASRKMQREKGSTTEKGNIKFRLQQLPILSKRTSMNFQKFEHEPELIRKGFSANEKNTEYKL